MSDERPRVEVTHTGGGIWAAEARIPAGLERQCLAHPNGGVLMSRVDAIECAKAFAVLTGWELLIDE